jgi:rare lipoprotein A
VIVQVAAFSSHEHAEKAAAQVGGKVEPAGKFWRVRIVATTDEQARAALAKAKQSGYAGALILHHD